MPEAGRRRIVRLGSKCVVALNNRTLRRLVRARYVKNLQKTRTDSEDVGRAIAREHVNVFVPEDASFKGMPFDELVIDSAGKVLGGSFILFEKWFSIPSGFTAEGDVWRTDFTSDYVFPHIEYSRISAPEGIAEIKVPWEFGRMQYLVPLALAYRITHEVGYLHLYRKILESFSRSNPVGVGVQWVCTMEAGIRIFNVLLSFELVKPLLEENDQLVELVAVLACGHGTHIAENLETSARLQENNHYVADLLGLAAISASYPSSPQSGRWGVIARAELVRSANKQILDDGCSFERSVRYTRLLGELFFYAGKALHGTRYALPNSFWSRLGRLASFLDAVTSENGSSPQIGDNDSGRALAISTEGFGDLRLLGRLIEREAHGGVTDSFMFPEEAMLYASGVRGYAHRMERSASGGRLNEGARVFQDFGIALVRLGVAEVAFLAIDGFDRWSEVGHTHNDKLSVLLSISGRSVFVDPGTGSYTRDVALRNALRGTAQHSTLWLRGLEQNEFRSLFNFRRMGGATLRVVEEDVSAVTLRGVTDCYASRAGCEHTRHVRFVGAPIGLVIIDNLGEVAAKCDPIRSFVLHPGVTVERIDDRTLRLRSGEVALAMESNAPFALRDGLYSPSYGEVNRTIIVDTPYLFGENNEVRVGTLHA